MARSTDSWLSALLLGFAVPSCGGQDTVFLSPPTEGTAWPDADDGSGRNEQLGNAGSSHPGDSGSDQGSHAHQPAVNNRVDSQPESGVAAGSQGGVEIGAPGGVPDGSGTAGGNNPDGQAADESFPVGIADQLPQLTITTENNAPILDQETYLTANLRLTDSAFGNYEGTTEIRGRGNTTWDLPKKPYRVKLANSSSLLGMPANRHWVLLANYLDKTQIRTDVVFHLGRAIGMEYTPRSSFVDLHLNGQYQGIYQLTEHVRIDSDRVDIPELEVGDTDPALITGGYLIEVDNRRGEDYCIDSTHTGMVFCLVDPEDLLEPEWVQQRQYIESFIRQAEDAIFSESFTDPDAGYASFIDVDSAVDYFLVNELVKNVDGDLRTSTFLHKKRNGKLTFGPLWDYDLAIGNVIFGWADLTDGWQILSAPWFTRLSQDPLFSQMVRDRWNQIKSDGILDDVFAYIDAKAMWLSSVQSQNFAVWDILDTYLYPNRIVAGSYQGEVDAMKDWLQERIEWMDAQFNPVEFPDIVLSEISPNPNPDWVEVKNQSDSIVNLAGFRLRNRDGLEYAFRAGTLLQAQGGLRVPQTWFEFELGSEGSLGLYAPWGEEIDILAWSPDARP